MSGKHRQRDPKLAAKAAADALRDPDSEEWASMAVYDTDAIWALFQKLTCPVPCRGYVSGEGWHQECQKRAQDAMRALGFDPPDIDPIPEKDEEDWEF